MEGGHSSLNSVFEDDVSMEQEKGVSLMLNTSSLGVPKDFGVGVGGVRNG